MRGQPESKVFDPRPFGHIAANLGQDGLSQGGADALDGDQVYPDKTEQVRAGTVGGFVFGAGIGLDRGQRGQISGGVPTGFDSAELAFNFGVTSRNLTGEKVEQFKRLLKDE